MQVLKDGVFIEKETRPYTVVGEISEHGRSRMEIGCPFCGVVTGVYKWSLAGSGKRCKCGAKHTHIHGTIAA